MRVFKKTKTKIVLPLLDRERFEKAVEDCESVPLDKPIIEMNLGEFIEALSDEYECRFMCEKYAWKAFGKTKEFRTQMKKIIGYIEKMTPTPTAEEKKAGVGVDFPSFEERILVDAVRYFHLHSIADAENVKLADLILMMKADFATSQYERNYNRIQNSSK